MMAVSNLQSLEREVVESVVEELRRHGVLVQDDSGRRLASIGLIDSFQKYVIVIVTFVPPF